ncbi:hypothetical protein C9419_02540 [Paraburkholderia fungorum]|nr:MAG: hypothetical protein DI523_14750 [Paraburkholderia fungorum]QLD48009.1 hypothetical protein C9419_02540 [Paraburkholderia fungorum]
MAIRPTRPNSQPVAAAQTARKLVRRLPMPAPGRAFWRLKCCRICAGWPVRALTQALTQALYTELPLPAQRRCTARSRFCPRPNG